MNSIFSKLKLFFLSRLAYILINSSNYTYQLQVIDHRSESEKKGEKHPGLYCVWHRYIWVSSFFFRHKNYYTLASQSRDGEFITRVLQKMGYQVVRGSSSRGGASSLRQLYKILKKDASIIITPDGPQGPAQRVKPGIIYLQEKTEVKVYPVGLAVKNKKIFNSWDKFVLPWPLSPIVFIIGSPLKLPAEKSIEQRCQILEDKLSRLHQEAREILEEK